MLPRPAMPFSEIQSQDRAVSFLRAALRRGALHHAYLLGGPEGAGKHAAAVALAQAANCEQDRAEAQPHLDEACGKCPPCKKIAKGVHPDVIVLRDERAMVKAGLWEAKGGRTPSKDVVVDQIRDLVDRRLALKRFEGRRRFVIVDPADAMNVQAQNALLKTLEEPPAETTIVLVAANPDALLPTIRSRCAKVAFSPVGDGGLGALAEAHGAAITDAAALDPANALGWIAFGQAHAGDREEARGACEVLLAWLRDVLAVQAAGEAAPLALPAFVETTRRIAAAISPAEALARRERVEAAIAALRQNAAAPLALERMLIGWFHG
jgi:DNA polymerase-3 subunit delta'